MSRRTARDYAYKLIFQSLFHETDEADEAEQAAMFADTSLSDDDRDYMREVVDGVAAHHDDIKACIMRNLKNFTYERIFKPDLAALYLATYEMKYGGIPAAVAISEVVDIVKMYGSESSGKFVNGVLAGVFKETEDK